MASGEDGRLEPAQKKTYETPRWRLRGRLSGVTAAASGSGKQGPAKKPSDRRLKRDPMAIGQIAGGITLYRFRYLWSDVEMVGVMAQDVLAVRPYAVSVAEDGFYRVDYEALGTECTTYEAWLATQAVAEAA